MIQIREFSKEFSKNARINIVDLAEKNKTIKRYNQLQTKKTDKRKNHCPIQMLSKSSKFRNKAL